MKATPTNINIEVNKMDDLLKSIMNEQFKSSDLVPTFVGGAKFHLNNSQSQNTCPIPLVSDICSSPSISMKPVIEQSKARDVTFRYLMQLKLFDASVDLGDWAYEAYEAERSVSNQMKVASSLQHQIICGRIALECFLDLIAVCEKGSRLVGKSKFKSCRKWVLSKNMQYRKFIPIILAGFSFDRLYRTPEVHGTSRLPYVILEEGLESSPLFKVRFDLTNALQMSWTTLIDILYDRQGGAWTTVHDSDILTNYYQLDEEELENFLEDVFSQRMK